MLELKIRSIPGSLLLSALGILACVGSSFIESSPINISLPILLIGALLGYFIFNMLYYTKAKTTQLLKLTLIALIIFLAIAGISYAVLTILSNKSVLFNADLTLSASIFYYASCIIFGILSTLMLYTMEKPKNVESIDQIVKDKIENKIKEEINKKNEVIEPKEIVAPTVHPEPKIQQEIKITETYTKPEIVEKPIEKPVFEENNKRYGDKEESVPKEPTEELETLPDITLEETEKESKSGVIYDESIFDYDNDDIPDNIRLNEGQASSKIEGKGMISSIGKLLINNRDIENIIETNELMQQIGCTVEDVDIVSMSTGVKIYEKFNKIMVEYTQVKDLTMSNRAGFTIASIIQDNRRAETVGAIASGAFLVLKNYLARLEINNMQKVFFETENTIHSIFKVDEFLLFFTTEKNFEPVNYNQLNDIFAQDNVSGQDLSLIKDIQGVLESATSDKNGILISAINSENPKRFASISSAIFENLKVFITNIQPVKLQKITVIAEEKVLTIKKFNDKIAGVLTSSQGPVKLSDKIIEIEKLLK